MTGHDRPKNMRFRYGVCRKEGVGSIFYHFSILPDHDPNISKLGSIMFYLLTGTHVVKYLLPGSRLLLAFGPDHSGTQTSKNRFRMVPRCPGVLSDGAALGPCLSVWLALHPTIGWQEPTARQSRLAVLVRSQTGDKVDPIQGNTDSSSMF